MQVDRRQVDYSRGICATSCGRCQTERPILKEGCCELLKAEPTCLLLIKEKSTGFHERNKYLELRLNTSTKPGTRSVRPSLALKLKFTKYNSDGSKLPSGKTRRKTESGITLRSATSTKMAHRGRAQKVSGKGTKGVRNEWHCRDFVSAQRDL